MKKKILGFINQGFISIMDQGLFSGTNFLMSILLGRWLDQSSYGTFSVVFSIFLLIAGIYTSFLLEPLSIYGLREEKRDFEYFGSILKIHLLLGGSIFILYIIGSLLGLINQTSQLTIMIVCSPIILSFWLVRRRHYSLLQPKIALLKSFVYAILTLVFLYLFVILEILSSESYFIILSLSSVIIFLPNVKELFSGQKDNLIRIIKQNWNYGKWIAIASLLQWSSSQIYIILVANQLNVVESAGYRAIQNFSQPFEQISTGLIQFLIPWFSSKLEQENYKKIFKQLPLVSIVIALLGIIYLVFILIFQHQISLYVYQDKYIDYLWLFPLLILVPIIMSLSIGAQIGTRIIEKSNYLLYAYSLSSIFTLIAGPILINKFGLQGAALGRILSATIYSLSLSLIFIFKRNKRYEE